MASNNRQNVTWVEGVRGVASFFVVVTHLCRAWNYSLWFPRDNQDATPQLLQLPFLRLPWQGRIGVTMFAFLTGYVCAIKPLRQVKSGNLSGALVTLGKSAFRRPPRLILPATIALFISWLAAQLGGFNVALRCDSGWLRSSSPQDIGGLDTEIPRLFKAFQDNWTFGHQPYDDHQWALLPLLQGAFLIYVTLFATIFMKFRMRVFTISLLFSWYWWCSIPFKETFECQFLYGVLLCDIGSDKAFREFVNSYPRTRRTVQTVLMVLGVYVAGYPGERADWAGWSQQLIYVGEWIFPAGTKDYSKRWTAVGWDLMVTGIWLSPSLQAMFSNKLFMWIGRNSFAVYLTHGTLLRVVLARFIYGWSLQSFSIEERENQEPIYHYIPRTQSWLVFAIAIPVWFALLYTVAHLWTTYVDSWCAKATKWLEEMMFEEEDEKGAAQFA
ncbi:acyltransferase 3 [Massariosphaeria phaeospora]|uniref:Acyltransferase 3 n=1 Tax=Massariosphaeria phaeospora TaxID=100035 RepID=A0A7C8I6Z0_9PLEO|nr:acyltransferase 3 [Massariosphaeria phaeospora]